MYVLYISIGIVGVYLVAELSRCLGNKKKFAYVVASLTLLAAPIALPIAAISRRRKEGDQV